MTEGRQDRRRLGRARGRIPAAPLALLLVVLLAPAAGAQEGDGGWLGAHRWSAELHPEVRVYDVHPYLEFEYRVDGPAYVAAFEVIPGIGATLVLPDRARHRKGGSEAFGRFVDAGWHSGEIHRDAAFAFRRASRGSGGSRFAIGGTPYVSGRGYLLVIASREPLHLSRFTTLDDYRHSWLASDLEYAGDPFGAMSRLIRRVVPFVEGDHWGAAYDVYPIWPLLDAYGRSAYGHAGFLGGYGLTGFGACSGLHGYGHRLGYGSTPWWRPSGWDVLGWRLGFGGFPFGPSWLTGGFSSCRGPFGPFTGGGLPVGGLPRRPRPIEAPPAHIDPAVPVEDLERRILEPVVALPRAVDAELGPERPAGPPPTESPVTGRPVPDSPEAVRLVPLPRGPALGRTPSAGERPRPVRESPRDSRVVPRALDRDRGLRPGVPETPERRPAPRHELRERSRSDPSRSATRFPMPTPFRARPEARNPTRPIPREVRRPAAPARPGAGRATGSPTRRPTMRPGPRTEARPPAPPAPRARVRPPPETDASDPG